MRGKSYLLLVLYISLCLFCLTNTQKVITKVPISAPPNVLLVNDSVVYYAVSTTISIITFKADDNGVWSYNDPVNVTLPQPAVSGTLYL